MILCRERLSRIQLVLGLHNGDLPLRTLTRSYHLYPWEIEQAAALGWVEFFIRKPHTGRPSRIVRRVSETQGAKLPLWRAQIEKPISFRHWHFALISAKYCVKGGSSIFWKTPPYTYAYLKAFPRAKKRRAATASMSRLLKRPDVRAARAWHYAGFEGVVPKDERMPDTAGAIWRRLRELGSWRAGR